MVMNLYPLKRYGITMSILWPRLYEVLSENTRQRIEDANIYLDFTTNMSLLSIAAVAFAVFAAFYGTARTKTSEIAWLLILLFGFRVFYLLAIEATRAVSAQVEAAVDLFRLKLLDALGIDAPANSCQESEIWKKLHHFIGQAIVSAQPIQSKKTSASSIENEQPTLPSSPNADAIASTTLAKRRPVLR
jgi:hypothetical protein